MGRLRDPGDVACDHYNRLEQDLDLLAALGVTAYRFSIAWTRVFPRGRGEVNQAGLGFYRRLVDGLVERGIQPWATLYHWDLPQALQERGGWASRDTVDDFAAYAAVVGEDLGDRVSGWITVNEPWVAAHLGHLYGVFAPGISDWPTALQAAHHLLLAHGRSAAILRELSAAKVGIAIDCRPARPASEAPQDVAAAAHFDGFRNRWFFDPVFGRGYPAEMREAYTDAGRFDPAMVHDGDMDEIAAPLDFLGVNYYTTLAVSAGQEELDDPELEPGAPAAEGYTEMGWAIDPDGLADYLHALWEAYRPRSIVVTENGASFSDGPGPSGEVADLRRVDYLRRHIEAVIEARQRGVPVAGYFVWSLLDNLEWTHGFSQRFGLVWVDHQSQLRIPKASYHWYRQAIDAEGAYSTALAGKSQP